MTGVHSLLIDGTLAIIVLFAALCDLASRRIPNWLTVSGVVVGFGIHISLAGAHGIWVSAAGMALALLVYFPLFALNALGAGDVKLMAAIGAITGPLPWFVIFVATCLVGGLLALIVVMSKRRLLVTLWNTVEIAQSLLRGKSPAARRPVLDFRSPGAITLPHGVSIAIAALLTIALGRLEIL